MKKLKIIILIFFVLAIIYIGLSYILLDGKIIYSTSFNESNIKDSKAKGIFVTDSLDVEITGDVLKKITPYIHIWTNKRCEVKYFGILFYQTFYNKDWRYLNIKINKNDIINTNEVCIRKSNIIYLESCCNKIPTFTNDIVKLQLVTCKAEKEIGYLKILIK